MSFQFFDTASKTKFVATYKGGIWDNHVTLMGIFINFDITTAKKTFFTTFNYQKLIKLYLLMKEWLRHSDLVISWSDFAGFFSTQFTWTWPGSCNCSDCFNNWLASFLPLFTGHGIFYFFAIIIWVIECEFEAAWSSSKITWIITQWEVWQV